MAAFHIHFYTCVVFVPYGCTTIYLTGQWLDIEGFLVHNMVYLLER